jgi:omega-amidase
MSKLLVATIQSDLHWENIDANLVMFEQKIALLQGKADVVVLPEMFSTGFSMNTALAENQDGKAMQWLQQTATKYNLAICGSLMMKNRYDVYNRFVWMNANGTYFVYNKRHLFRMGNEHEHFKAGNEKLIIDFKGFKIQLLVCYDLRFPVWIRRTPFLLWPVGRSVGPCIGNHYFRQGLLKTNVV